jgi:formylglycine-generating enzyme required for sulfatase activity
MFKMNVVTSLFAILIFSNLLGCIKKPPENMFLVPAGTFIMGTDEVDADLKALEYGIVKPWFVDEQPAHEVELQAYYIDKYEVTTSQYQQFLRDTGHRAPPYWTGFQFPDGTENYPVVMVSWEDAQAFCHWGGKRLPQEAEWEKAARPDQRLYPWGNTFDPNRANTGGTRGGLTPVGSYENPASPYGVYDMIGNVWEWTADWYQPYPGNSSQDEYYDEKYKVLRGNSWATVGHYPSEITQEIVSHNSRTTFRLYADPKGVLNDIGFRCVKSAE